MQGLTAELRAISLGPSSSITSLSRLHLVEVLGSLMEESSRVTKEEYRRSLLSSAQLASLPAKAALLPLLHSPAVTISRLDPADALSSRPPLTRNVTPRAAARKAEPASISPRGVQGSLLQ